MSFFRSAIHQRVRHVFAAVFVSLHRCCFDRSSENHLPAVEYADIAAVDSKETCVGRSVPSTKTVVMTHFDSTASAVAAAGYRYFCYRHSYHRLQFYY